MQLRMLQARGESAGNMLVVGLPAALPLRNGKGVSDGRDQAERVTLWVFRSRTTLLAGWARCTICVDDACATVTAAYLSGAWEDLASAVAPSLRGHPHATAWFTEEPGEYRWIFEPVSEGRVNVRILEFKEMWAAPRRGCSSHFSREMWATYSCGCAAV